MGLLRFLVKRVFLLFSRVCERVFWNEKTFDKFVRTWLDLSTHLHKPKIRPKTLLLIRLDALGDYVLFRNFLKPIRESYKDYEITFLCNSANLEIFNAYDTDCVDKLYPISTQRWLGSKWRFLYRFYHLYRLHQKSYEICINPTFTRFSMKEDLIMQAMHALHKIGSYGEMLSWCWKESAPTLQHNDKVYTTLLKASPDLLFEFERNREFCAQLLNKNLDSVRLHMDLPSSPPSLRSHMGCFS
ncbi:hypothetical protein NHP190003_11780 [Helicobacter sp. NHP19-003]|uniref:Uncharacterized protein n=1 Tax=Helicobacter gastrocanis TaxID=2849641 RepID=A0ABM7SB84_9HELI|nr:hypothetical protein [Helicobacter sp. NHP19-003]BCZ17896.1 hypothetical protein NHP190003_11780 [Helicobacter sp. NHP19-003]